MTKSRRRAALAALIAGFCAASGPAASNEIAAIVSRDRMMSMDASKAERIARSGEARLREELVRDAAQVMGTQGGYAERAGEIRAIIDRRTPQLDRIFDFSPLCRDGRVLSPVVELVEDVLAVDDAGNSMRETARVLRVIAPARLVTVPPTWRDWLTIAATAPEVPDAAAFPANGREREVWQNTVNESWDVGRRHADAVYAAQIETLKRDYQGMLRYHDLLAQQIIAPAEVGQADLGIVREDAELRLGDRIYTVRVPAKFRDRGDWRAIVAPTGAED